MKWLLPMLALALAGGFWFYFSLERREPFVAPPLPAPEGPLKVYHLGHSLVGHDMPSMLAQMVGQGHSWNNQLGWGTTLKAHWEPDVDIAGFDDNRPPNFRDAREAVSSGEYDAVVLTEMVELKDAIKFFDSPRYAQLWADAARGASETTVVYLYETWHNLDTEPGWLERIDNDLEALWVRKVLGPDTRRNPERPVYLIPGGQVLGAVARAAESGEIEGIDSRDDLFLRKDNGELDTIHVNDLGLYVVALTHYAVLYHRSPVGLPHELNRADGSPADSFSSGAARAIQSMVWDVVTSIPRTGVSAKSVAS